MRRCSRILPDYCPGIANKITLEVRHAAGELVDNPADREKLKRDLISRKIHPTIEQMLWHYAKGKLVDRVESGKRGDFSQMTDAELNAAIRQAAANPLPED
jgi:hypothetical protein